MSLFKVFRSALSKPSHLSFSKDCHGLETTIGYQFSDPSLLREALTHPSFDSRKSGCRHNQRLEFLGDSVVGCVLAKWLYKRFPDAKEGELSRKKSLLVRGNSLSSIARAINLQEFLILGKSEHISHGNLRPSVLEDAFEALIGAIYLDSDYPTVERTMQQWENLFLSTLKEKSTQFNPKGKLQEVLQSRPSPFQLSYQLVKQTGPDHKKTFHVDLRINGNVFSSGSGKSKKKAEEQAALAALRKMTNSEEN
jgi:ribonuclease-3